MSPAQIAREMKEWKPAIFVIMDEPGDIFASSRLTLPKLP
jgi:hypothetical protein